MSTDRLIKSYLNESFLRSGDARLIRILAEYLEPESRFRDQQIEEMIVFFGSARTLSQEEACAKMSEVQSRTSDESSKEFQQANRQLKLSRYYEFARELSHRLTKWSQNLPETPGKFVIGTGGGPGMMEAANRGATEAGGSSVGLNISLPFEQHPNDYISKELCFEFHYFFMRKLWFIHLARGLVLMPGGFGTLDEMMEALTLLQTEKITQKKLPIVLVGKEYWDDVIDFKAMEKWGMISEEDLDLIYQTDDPNDAFDYLTHELLQT